MASELKRRIPPAFMVTRFVLGPALAVACLSGRPALVVGILLAAMLSDIFDGVVARRLGIATERLRVADSWVDAWFFLWVGMSAVLTRADILRAYSVPIGIEVALQLAAYAYDLARYGRITSLHAYSAKMWAITLYAAAVGVLAFHCGALIWLAFAFGLFSAADAMAIKLLIPGWKHDVLSCFHAARMRRAQATA